MVYTLLWLVFTLVVITEWMLMLWLLLANCIIPPTDIYSVEFLTVFFTVMIRSVLLIMAFRISFFYLTPSNASKIYHDLKRLYKFHLWCYSTNRFVVPFVTGLFFTQIMAKAPMLLYSVYVFVQYFVVWRYVVYLPLLFFLSVYQLQHRRVTSVVQ
ncbi:hypothetical protein TorRG33x02_014770 [Trema orientale]|uniref:Transmembrane protein n=1 Tax=Trema orientale TaxID=63057 RepID=A0A2P5FXG5_TREOI|nr:hypothetical protein TorRG33x02_014770 [Trema orientale]